MEIEPEKLKKLFTVFLQTLRAAERESLAYGLAFVVLKEKLGWSDAELNALLEQARESPQLRDLLRAKYDEPLERLLATFDQAGGDQELLEFLRKWVPKSGEPN